MRSNGCGDLGALSPSDRAACARCGHERDEHCGCGCKCMFHTSELKQIAPPIVPGGKPLMGYEGCRCEGYVRVASA